MALVSVFCSLSLVMGYAQYQFLPVDVVFYPEYSGLMSLVERSLIHVVTTDHCLRS